ESEYQQNPIMVGGGMFPVEKFKVVPVLNHREIKRSARYWDKAATEGGGAFTAGVLMHQLADGRFLVEDVRHGQWNGRDRQMRIEETAKSDAQLSPRYEIWVEQEPGSGGKESAEATIRRLRGFKVFAEKSHRQQRGARRALCGAGAGRQC